MINKLWLIGAGPMAVEYSKVLNALNVSYEVIGRGQASGKSFQVATGKDVRTGGLSALLESTELQKPESAIVAVGVEKLAETTIELLENGFRNILVEKPAGLNFEEISQVAAKTKEKNGNVLVGYNRRFYASVMKAKEIIEEDGGVTSFNFEFTEWSHQIEKLVKAPGVKENWLLANSSHVIDLAFYLGGQPKEISTYTAGSLDWHPSASVFAGSGVAENGALFTYKANWESAGRWGVEILTKKRKLILKPIEKLQVQKRGSIIVEHSTNVDYSLDEKFKPGLYLQTENFINNNHDRFLDIWHQKRLMKTYNSISKYL